MTIHFDLIPLLSLAAGIAVLAVPRQTRYIVGIYLIAFGVIELIR